jgi:hypothetical protein
MVLIKGKTLVFARFFVVFGKITRKAADFIVNEKNALTFPTFDDIILVTKE